MKPKNIDRLFQEKLKDFEASPSPEVWNKIASSLQKKKQRKALIWLKIGGSVAAIFLIGFFVLKNPIFENTIENNNFNQDEIIITNDFKTEEKSTLPKEEEVIASSPSEPTKATESTEILKNKIVEKQKINNSKKTEISNTIATKTLKKQYNLNKTVSTPIEKEVPTNSIAVTKSMDTLQSYSEESIADTFYTQIEKEQDSLQKRSLEEKSILVKINSKNTSDSKKDFVAEIEEEKQETNVEKGKSWIIAPSISQIFQNSFSNSSSVDSRLDNAPKQGNNSTAFGIKVAFQASKKWQIQSGIHQIQLGQTTSNIPLIGTSSLSNTKSFDVSNNLSVEFNDSDVSGSESPNREVITGPNTNLNQTYNYLEIPLEAKYAVFTSEKLGFHIISGFSALLLTDNSLEIESNSIPLSRGEASNLNPVNFSLNFGTDFEYHFSKKWFFNASPMLKIQTNTFEQVNSKPYFLGIYTGLNYKF